MKTSLAIVLYLAVFLCYSRGYSAPSESIGFVSKISGEVFLVSAQRTLQAVPNMKIGQGDTVKTGMAGSVGLIFDDNTVVSLGPDSEIAVESFLFNPVDNELSFVTKLIKGTFCFITGQIAKLAPKKVKFETPEATLGVRGTKFLVKID
jgi:hypothetical protein